MLLKIVWIAYLMLPETALPYTALSLSLPRQALSGLVSTGLKVSTGESFLDRHPPLREIVVALRQTPHAMQMLRQQAHRHHLEGPSLTNAPPRSAQAPSRQVIDKKTTAPICHHREKIITATESRPSVVRHIIPSRKSNNDRAPWANQLPILPGYKLRYRESACTSRWLTALHIRSKQSKTAAGTFRSPTFSAR